MATQKKIDFVTSLTTCADGLTANYPATQTWVFANETYKRADILSLLQAGVTAAQNTATAHAAWLTAAEAEAAQSAALHPVLLALKRSLEVQYGASSTKMAEFGFEPAKVPVKSTAVKAAAVAKGKATREKRKAALAAVTPTTPGTTPKS